MASRDLETQIPERFGTVLDGNAPNVVKTRMHLGLSQERFAALLEVSLLAVQNWETGYPVHPGPARVPLRLAADHPQAFLDEMARRACRH